MPSSKHNAVVNFVSFVIAQAPYTTCIRVLSDKEVRTVLDFLAYARLSDVKLYPGKIERRVTWTGKKKLNPFFQYFVCAKDGRVHVQATYWLDQMVMHIISISKKNKGLDPTSIAKDVRRKAREIPILYVKVA